MGDAVGTFNLATSGAPPWVSSGTALLGSGPSFTTTTQYANNAKLSAQLKLQPPFTVALGFRRLGTPTSGAILGGLRINSAATPQYFGLTIDYANTTDLHMSSSNTTTFLQSASFLTPVLGTDYIVVASSTVTAWTAYVFPINPAGNMTTSTGAWGGVGLIPTYTTTSQIVMGADPAFSRNINANIWFMGLWSRALTQPDAVAIASNPWQMFRKRGWLFRSPLPSFGTPRLSLVSSSETHPAQYQE